MLQLLFSKPSPSAIARATKPPDDVLATAAKRALGGGISGAIAGLAQAIDHLLITDNSPAHHRQFTCSSSTIHLLIAC